MQWVSGDPLGVNGSYHGSTGGQKTKITCGVQMKLVRESCKQLSEPRGKAFIEPKNQVVLTTCLIIFTQTRYIHKNQQGKEFL